MSATRGKSTGIQPESSHRPEHAKSATTKPGGLAGAHRPDQTDSRRLIYLHGFRSSPASFKAGLLRNWFERRGVGERFLCPQIPVAPREAIRALELDLRLKPHDVLVGSSLGGLYAHCLAEAHGCRAVLLNPAVHPSRDLARYIGTVQAWHSGASFDWRSDDVDALRELESTPVSNASRYLLVAATGDEVIDWRDMTARYAECSHIIVDGSNHALDAFGLYLERVIHFAQLDLPAPRD
jgi:predicted esterase YcpF (UPF0227 family)